MPLSTPEQCRHNAEECERMAAMVTNPSHRETLLHFASCWRILADEKPSAPEPTAPLL